MKVARLPQGDIVPRPLVCSLAKYNMVKDFNTQQLPGADEVAGDSDIRRQHKALATEENYVFCPPHPQ